MNGIRKRQNQGTNHLELQQSSPLPQLHPLSLSPGPMPTIYATKNRNERLMLTPCKMHRLAMPQHNPMRRSHKGTTVKPESKLGRQTSTHPNLEMRHYSTTSTNTAMTS